MTTTPHGLARRSVGAGSLWLFGVSASAPMTVLAGGVVTTFAVTGVVAVPLSFLLLAGALLLFSVGFAGMATRAPHAATFAAVLARGLGRGTGVAGAMVALLAYNAIQISLYGLLGGTAAALLGGPWWSWALAAWALVAALGVRHIHLSARVIGAVLAVELALILALDIVSFTHPAEPGGPGGVLTPLSPDQLLVDGVGGVFALGVAAFVGFESITAFGEETRNPRSVATALATTLAFLGLLYTASSWALAVAVGPGRVARVTRSSPDIPFTILATHLGPTVAAAGLVLLAFSIIGAMISFHSVVARYVFALGREGILPRGYGTRIDRRAGVPLGGSTTQSGLALATIIGFALAGTEPIGVMFTWLSTLAAIGITALMIATSIAVIVLHRPTNHHRHRADGRPTNQAARPGPWTRVVAPATAALALSAVLVITVISLGSTVGEATASWLLPATLTATAAAGACRAAWLHHHKPDTWRRIGRGQPKPLAVLDGALAEHEL